MNLELAHLRAGRAWQGDGAGCDGGSRVERGLAVYERPSGRAPLVSVPVTSAYPCADRWSRPGALSQMSGIGASPGGGAGCRLIITREDKGVVDK